jgi:hypothetical protein
MPKYRLINKITNEENICSKVVIDGFDYYLSDEVIKDVRPYNGRWQIEKDYILNKFPTYLTDLSDCKLVIATNNQSIDIPKIINEKLQLVKDFSEEGAWQCPVSFEIGYNKSQETYPFSEKDMIDFAKWSNRKEDKSKKELLVIWKQIKTIYYSEN